MKLLIMSKLDKQILKKAKEISYNMDSSLLLLSDALYLINNIEKDDFNSVYGVNKDYRKRFNKDSNITLLDYEDLVDLLMDDSTYIINL